MKKYWLVCSNCGYYKEVYFEQEIFDNDDCPLCNRKMALDINQGKQEQNLGDNFPVLEQKNIISDYTAKIIINSLAEEIKQFGEQRVWDNINLIELEKRLEYIEMFFSAKRLIEKGEY